LTHWAEICRDLPIPQELRLAAYFPAVKTVHPKIIFLMFNETSLHPLFAAKIPTNPESAATLKSAFEILKEFHSSPRLKDLAPSTPRPVYEGEITGFPLFIEEYCWGRNMPQKGYHFRFRPERCFLSAAAWIKEFHLRTREIARGEEEIQRLFISPIESTIAAFPESKERLNCLKEECLKLSGTPFPVVYGHGDYKSKNILFGKDAEDLKIIDWEGHKKRHLPLFDLIRLSVWFICKREGLSYSDGLQACFFGKNRVNSVIRDYLRTMEIGNELKRILVPLYLIERIVKNLKNVGREAARGHLERLNAWFNSQK